MRAKTRLATGMALAVGISVSGCAAPVPVTSVSTTTAPPIATTTDPATVGGSDFGPGPYRVEATVAVSENPRSIAIDPELRTAYVAHDNESRSVQSVAVIDTRTQTVTAEIPVGQVFPGKPQAITVDPATHLVYLVGGNYPGRVLVIDPVGHTVVATIEFDGDPEAIVVDSSRNTLYVASRRFKTVTVINTVTRAVVATIPVDGQPSGMAVDPATHHLWAVSGNSVSVIDPATYTISTTIPFDEALGYIGIDPQSRTAYLTHDEGNSVSLIDTVSRTPTGSVSLGKRGRAYAVVVDPDLHTVYLTGMVFQTVTMIDTRTRAVTAARNSGITSANRYGSNTYGAAVDPVSHFLYVTNSNAAQVEVIAAR